MIRAFATCMDLAPTVLDLLDIRLPESGDKKVKHRGVDVHGMTGRSWVNAFDRPHTYSKGERSEEWSVYPEDAVIGWELHAQAALRQGPYRIVHLRKSHGGRAKANDDEGGWELFNVSQDPGETCDLSEAEPERKEELLRLWDEYVTDHGVVWGPDALKSGLSKDEAPHLHESDSKLQRTWIQTPVGSKPTL
jgi:arylsulfatase A-like enzyme